MEKEKVLTIEIPHTHTCTKCGTYYENLTEGFYKRDKEGKKGYNTFCIPCYKEMTYKRYLKLRGGVVAKKEKKTPQPYVPIKRNVRYTEGELMYLEKSWGSIPVSRIAKKLGRSEEAIRIKAYKLKLGSQLESLDVLLKRDVINLLNVDSKTVSKYILKGLNLKKDKVTKNPKILSISIEEFLDWLESNKDKIDWEKVDRLGLVSIGFDSLELDRLISESIAQNKRRTLSDKDKKEIREMYIKYFKYEEIAKKLNKEHSAVKWYIHTCIKKGILEQNTKRGRLVRDMNRSNYGWTEWQDKTLLTLFREGKTLREISVIVGKTLSATKTRNQKLSRMLIDGKTPF